MGDMSKETSTGYKIDIPDAVANMQEPCTLQSNSPTSNLTPMATDPEQVLRGTEKPSLVTTFRNPQHEL